MGYTITVDIEIEAPVEKAWEILSDLERYGEWNPFLIKVESNKVLGDPTILHVKWIGAKKSFIQPEILTGYEENKKICWGMSWKPSFLLKANRCQTLQQLSENRCTYRSEETFSGLFSHLTVFLFKKKIVDGFEATARALKERAEK